MNARNRVFLILGILTVGSLAWYLITTRRSNDLQLIGTVDANEVLVSSRVPGLIQTLTVTEGQRVQGGQLIAVIDSDDLQDAYQAALAAAAGQQSQLRAAMETERQNRGETGSATAAAEAQVSVAQASLAQAQANYNHQLADTSRIVALAKQGIMSAQARDDAETTLQADAAAVKAARETLTAAQASLRQARAHELLSAVSAHNVNTSRANAANAQALANEAGVQAGYTRIYAPATGIVDAWAARQGEVVTAGEPIISIMDLTQTWVYAPLPETQEDSVRIGDSLRVVMPSGATLSGKVIAKATEADFATQRDVSRRKRDIRTVQLKLLIPNPGEQYVPGITAEVYVPASRLVKQ